MNKMITIYKAPCELCGKELISRKKQSLANLQLQRHKEGIHGQGILYECKQDPFCNYKTYRRADYRRHKKQHYK